MHRINCKMFWNHFVHTASAICGVKTLQLYRTHEESITSYRSSLWVANLIADKRDPEGNIWAKHAHKDSHIVGWDKTRILEIESNTRYIKYKESAHMACLTIQSSQPNLGIYPIWIPLSSNEVKVKRQAVKTHRIMRGRGSHIGSEIAVRLSALLANLPLPPGIFLVLISVRDRVDPGAGMVMSIQKSNYLVGNRTRDLLDSSIVLEPPRLPCSPISNEAKS
jgi:hypothetical protein